MYSIAIILPVFNGGNYLQASVKSVLTQLGADFELLVIDDCSTDGSREWLESIYDNRLKLFKNDVNRGLFYNLNFLINHSSAPLIKLWAQDDIMNPGCLEAFVSFYQNHQDVGFIYCNREVIDEYGEITSGIKTDVTPKIISTAYHNHVAWFTGSIAGNIANVCLVRDAINAVGLFNEKMKISGDFDIQARLAQKFDTGFINQPLIKLRNHSGQLSRNSTYYFLHVKEDLAVFKFILNSIPLQQQQAGKKDLRRYKLMFYYTLMLKALGGAQFGLFGKYLKQLSSFDNIFLLTVEYIKQKVFKVKRPFKKFHTATQYIS
ncbi:MAG: glycosyltransferase [Ferruginibacter sp.]|nr:glycosyltransferase [Ferruginibacter sp.]